jgi:hemerythrin-like domain-containing protein
LPGFDSPAVGFEQPFEMLVACHERVQRSLDLLQRLMDYLDTRGHDRSTRSAAADVLRYFDIAAPLHHEDEELHVFPALAGNADAPLRSAIDRLMDDHARMATLWSTLRGDLLRWRDDPAAALMNEQIRRDVQVFLGLYAAHIATEENLVYPSARACFDAVSLARIGAEMQRRRRVAEVDSLSP